MDYFKDCKNKKDIQKTYRTWAKKLHPDKNGNTEESKLEFQELENQLRSALNNVCSDGDEVAKMFNDMVNENIDELFEDIAKGKLGGLNKLADIMAGKILKGKSQEEINKLSPADIMKNVFRTLGGEKEDKSLPGEAKKID